LDIHLTSVAGKGHFVIFHNIFFNTSTLLHILG
jgi:hypothetical protein